MGTTGCCGRLMGKGRTVAAVRRHQQSSQHLSPGSLRIRDACFSDGKIWSWLEFSKPKQGGTRDRQSQGRPRPLLGEQGKWREGWRGVDRWGRRVFKSNSRPQWKEEIKRLSR